MKNEEQKESVKPPSRTKVWLKRVGIAGFLFFLVKGLIWIGIFIFAAKGCE